VLRCVVQLHRLSALEDRLSELETNMYPVHKATERLRFMHESMIVVYGHQSSHALS
jgi:hypothetical protein